MSVQAPGAKDILETRLMYIATHSYPTEAEDVFILNFSSPNPSRLVDLPFLLHQSIKRSYNTSSLSCMDRPGTILSLASNTSADVAIEEPNPWIANV